MAFLLFEIMSKHLIPYVCFWVVLMGGGWLITCQILHRIEINTRKI